MKKTLLPLATLLVFVPCLAGGALIVAPTDISGNTLWLDASDAGSITGSPVSAWADKSTLGLNSVTQATGAEQPTTGVNTLNGLNVLTFDGNDRLGKTGGTLPLSANDDSYTYIVLWRHNAPNRVETPYEQAGAGNGARSSVLRVNAAYGFNGQSNDAHAIVTTTTSAWRLTAMRVDNLLTLDGTNNIYLTDNGTLFTAATGSPATLAVGTTGIGVSQKVINGGERLLGDIAEIIVYDRLLSDGSIDPMDNELNDIQYFLQQKWDLGLGLTPTIPEPASSLFVVFGLGALLLRRKRC